MIVSQPNNSFDLQQFNTNFSNIQSQMLSCQKSGDYIQAQQLRLNAINYRNKWQEGYLSDLESKHNRALQNLQSDFRDKTNRCEQKWQNIITDYTQSSNNHIQQTKRNNDKEVSKLKGDMDLQLPPKVKESYQLLNLRQMQRHMAKQQNYTQAHLVQKRINQLYNQQLKAWNQERDKTINQAVTNTRNRQNKDMGLFNKKMQIQLQDHNSDCHNEKIALQQRYNLNLKQLKANHQRQVLSFKKEFRNKGGDFWKKVEEGISRST